MDQQELKTHFYVCQSKYTLQNISSRLLITSDLILKLIFFFYPYGEWGLCFGSFPSTSLHENCSEMGQLCFPSTPSKSTIIGALYVI